MAPDGLITTKTFSEILSELILLNSGEDSLPEQWLNLTQNQVKPLIFYPFFSEFLNEFFQLRLKLYLPR